MCLAGSGKCLGIVRVLQCYATPLSTSFFALHLEVHRGYVALLGCPTLKQIARLHAAVQHTQETVTVGTTIVPPSRVCAPLLTYHPCTYLREHGLSVHG